MQPILGYAEDALTYWALTRRLADVLQQLGDTSPPDDALLIYRPSFGRSGAPAPDSGRKSRAEFGEFDAIIATREAVYLAESKWDGSGGVRDGTITLRDKQCVRHDIFRWYLAAWRNDCPLTWNEFVASRSDEFERRFVGNKMAPPGSERLTPNLEFVLRRLTPMAPHVVDIVLYFAPPGFPMPARVDPDRFRLVTLAYATVGGGHFFEM